MGGGRWGGPPPAAASRSDVKGGGAGEGGGGLSARCMACSTPARVPCPTPEWEVTSPIGRMVADSLSPPPLLPCLPPSHRNPPAPPSSPFPTARRRWGFQSAATTSAAVCQATPSCLLRSPRTPGGSDATFSTEGGAAAPSCHPPPGHTFAYGTRAGRGWGGVEGGEGGVSATAAPRPSHTHPFPPSSLLLNPRPPPWRPRACRHCPHPWPSNFRESAANK